MAAIVGQGKEGAFQSLLLDALGTSEGILGKNITQQQIPGLLDEIISQVEARVPDARLADIGDFSELNAFLSAHLPPFNVCPAVYLSDDARHLLEFMGEKFSALKQFFFGASVRAVQIDDISTAIFTHEIPDDPRQALEVYELVRALLQEQSRCVVDKAESPDPNKPANGLYSEMTIGNFYEVIKSAGAELLIARNNDDCYGIYIYFNRGKCAPEDSEFFDRARFVLTQNQGRIVETFGEKFDPDSCASAFGVFISPRVVDLDDQDGGKTGRGLVYDAFTYHMLTELAQAPDHPKWLLGWVRTYPSPNTAIKAHIARGYYDVGIELPFEAPESSLHGEKSAASEPSKDAAAIESTTVTGGPSAAHAEEGMRLKLLLINLDQLAIHGIEGSEYRSSQPVASNYAREAAPRIARIRDVAAEFRFMDWDI